MSDILSPQGFEPNEPLENTDIQEVYQPTSGGIRRNKQVTLATLKDFFRKLTSFTANNIVESDGVGNLRTTNITTASVATAIAQTASNTNEIAGKLNQGVKTTDEPIFAGATIAGHNVDAELSQLRIDVNSNDSDISSLQSQITSNDGEIATLNSRVNQGVKTTDSPTFASVNTGQGANELYAMNQPVRTTDNVMFNGVNTNNVTLKKKMLTTSFGYSDSTFNPAGSLLGQISLPHGLTSSKIRSFTVSTSTEEFTTQGAQYITKRWNSTNIIFDIRSIIPSDFTVNATTTHIIITYEA